MKSHRYVPNLGLLQSLGEMNYARLLQLMPEVRLKIAHTFHVRQNTSTQYKVILNVIERGPYTTTLIFSIAVANNLSLWQKPFQLKIRLYHDAKMAEVLTAHHDRIPSGHYAYPNEKMYYPDEKEQLNKFLAECLAYCCYHGYTSEPAFSTS